jgi:outer membrane protein TolC
MPIGRGLFINERLTYLRKAKLMFRLSNSERQLQAMSVLADATKAYFDWKRNYEEMAVYQQYFDNANVRFGAIGSLVKQGDKPAIDSTEARIAVTSRLISLEDSRMKLAKSRLWMSTFLWLENDIPLELSEEMIPQKDLTETIGQSFQTETLTPDFPLDDHPKILLAKGKIEMLNLERRLMKNQLLPAMNVDYSYLHTNVDNQNSLWNDYKIGFNLNFPLFLRKERSALKITKFEIQQSEWDLAVAKTNLENKIEGQILELTTLSKQMNLTNQLIKDQSTLLQAEERLFTMGESSLFLINTRENNLVSARLAQIALENRYLHSHSDLFNIMAKAD